MATSKTPPPKPRYFSLKASTGMSVQLRDENKRLLTSIEDLDRIRTAVEGDVLAAFQAGQDKDAARAALRASAAAGLPGSAR